MSSKYAIRPNNVFKICGIIIFMYLGVCIHAWTRIFLCLSMVFSLIWFHSSRPLQSAQTRYYRLLQARILTPSTLTTYSSVYRNILTISHTLNFAMESKIVFSFRYCFFYIFFIFFI